MRSAESTLAVLSLDILAAVAVRGRARSPGLGGGSPSPSAP